MNFKRFLSSLNMGVVVFFAIGVMLIWQTAGAFVCFFSGPIDFADMLDGEKIKAGSRVEGSVLFALEPFATRTSYTRYSDGSRSGDKADGGYYVVPIENGNGYVGLQVRQADVALANQLVDETYEYLTGGAEPTVDFPFQGRVTVMDDELKGYFQEYLAEMGYSEAELEAMGEPLMIEYVSFSAVIIMFSIGVVLILLMSFLTFRAYKRQEA